MKTHNLKNNRCNFLLMKVLSIIIMLLTTYSVNAQDEQTTWELKGNKNTFIAYGSRKGKGKGKFVLYQNTKYDIKKIKENRNHVTINEFYLYRINSHEVFIDAFKNTFSKKRIEELADNKESIKVSFLLDEKGQVMSVDFMLLTNSIVSIYKLEKLEYELLNNITFSTTNPIEPNSFGLYSIRTTFTQVKNGEIRAIRKNEDLTKEYFQ